MVTRNRGTIRARAVGSDICGLLRCGRCGAMVADAGERAKGEAAYLEAQALWLKIAGV